MSEIAREIGSQPACWRQAALQGGELDGSFLPHGAHLVAVGCGTSLYVSQAFAALRESLGHGPADAFPASEAPTDRRYDSALVISRSGTTTEAVRYVERVTGARTVAIVGSSGTPLEQAADRTIVLGFADERSVVQTRFATSALALLRAHLGQDLSSVVEQAEGVLEEDLPIDPGRFSHFVFLGTGWGVGLANEAALKLREAARAWTESYPAMEFRHGPISVAGLDSVVWAVGPVDPSVLEDAAATGATVVGGARDPMAELVMIQRTAVALAESRGLDPDHPRHLTRSVVLS